jgi:hypothetical protein
VAPNGWYFEPDESHRWRVTVFVPRTHLSGSQVVRLSVQLVGVKADRFTLRSDDPQQAWFDDAIAKKGPIKVRLRDFNPPGLLHFLTRGEQKLVSVVFVPPGDIAPADRPDLLVCIAQRDEQKRRCTPDQIGPADRRLARYYEVGRTSLMSKSPSTPRRHRQPTLCLPPDRCCTSPLRAPRVTKLGLDWTVTEQCQPRPRITSAGAVGKVLGMPRIAC